MILKKEKLFFVITIKIENSTTIRKAEIAFLLKEFKKLIKIYNDKVDDYLKNKYYFQNTKEIINDENVNRFSKINFEYFNLAKEFRSFILRHNVNHDHIAESVLNDIVKRPFVCILHGRQSNYNTDSDESESEDEEKTINNTLKQQIDDISQEKSISNNLKQLLIDNLLKQPEINKIFKDSTRNNKESMINYILNKKQPKIIILMLKLQNV